MTISAQEVAMANTSIALAAAGDPVAFARIVAAHHADVIRVAFVDPMSLVARLEQRS